MFYCIVVFVFTLRSKVSSDGEVVGGGDSKEREGERKRGTKKVNSVLLYFYLCCIIVNQ